MTLIFVYNAEAGILAGIMDSVHKIVSPATYACDLCAITYGVTSMKSEWRTWLRTLTVPVQFFHRADFKAAWPDASIALPAILRELDGRLETLVSADEFRSITQVNQLISLLEHRLAETMK